MSLRPLLLLLSLCALALTWPHDAAAQVRHCVTADGQSIFTDRQCEAVSAVERAPRSEAPTGAQVRRAGGCARTLDDLVFEMNNAIQAHDANRLAAFYHWPGTSAETGYRIWTQLDAVANRPLVDIVPVMPTSTPPASAAPGSDGISNDATAPVDGNLYPQTSVRRNPVALRVEQVLSNSATPSSTVFGLTHYFGCWWVRF